MASTRAGRWCALLGLSALLTLACGCRSIESRLKIPVSANFEKTPLGDALRELSRQSGVPIELHRSAAGSKAEPITLWLRQVRCKDALAWVLRLSGPWHLRHRYSSDRFGQAEQGALIYLVERGRVVVVSGKEFLRRQPKPVRYYDLADVCADREAANKLMEVIKTTIAPGTCGDGDSPKPTWMALRSGKLVVCHYEHVHQQVKELLASLRRSARRAGRGDEVQGEQR